MCVFQSLHLVSLWAHNLGALGLGRDRLVIWRVFFTKLKSCIPLANPKMTKKKIGKKSNFFIIRLSFFVGIWIGGGGDMEATFSSTPLKVVEKSLQVGIRGPSVRVINGKIIYRVTIDSFGFKYGTLFAPAKKERLFGPFGTRRLRSTSGEHVLHLSPNNVWFASPIQVNPLNTSFRIAFKLGGLDVGQHLSCINHVEFVRAIMIFLIGNKPSLGKKILRNTVRKSKFGTILEVLPFGPFGWNVMTKCSITNNDMKRG